MSSENVQIAATLATLIVVATGVTFAALQVRQETLARRLQAISALFDDVWPAEAARANGILIRVPIGFDDSEMNDERKDALRTLTRHYNRLGFLLQTGLVKERDVLGFAPFGIFAADNLAKFRDYMTRGDVGLVGMGVTLDWEYLAVRAEAYWQREGRHQKASIARYRGEAGALTKQLNELAAARATSR